MRSVVVVLLFVAVTAFGACSSKSVIEERSVAEQTPKIDSFVVTFSGDLMLHMPQVNAAKSNNTLYLFDHYFAYIRDVWQNSDYAILNLETTISSDGNYSGYPTFSSPWHILYSIHRSGIDAVALANNHILDRGVSGVKYTLAEIERSAIKSFGCYMDSVSEDNYLFIDKNEFRVAVLNYTYGTNGIRVPKGVHVNLIDTTLIKIHITNAKKRGATHIISFFHWGNEYETRSSKEQKKVAMWCRANGVDVVVGSHPHVVQEVDHNNLIVYSLGNLASNQTDKNCDVGATVSVTLRHNSAHSLSVVPHWVDWKRHDRSKRYSIIPKGIDAQISDSVYFKKAIMRAEKLLSGSKK